MSNIKFLGSVTKQSKYEQVDIEDVPEEIRPQVEKAIKEGRDFRIPYKKPEVKFLGAVGEEDSFLEEFVTTWKEGIGVIKRNPEAILDVMSQPFFEREPVDIKLSYIENVKRGLYNTAKAEAEVPFILPKMATGITRNIIGEPLQHLLAGEKGKDEGAYQSFATNVTMAAIEEAKGVAHMIISGIPGIDKDWVANLFQNPDTVVFGKLIARDIARGTIRTVQDISRRVSKTKQQVKEGKIPEATIPETPTEIKEDVRFPTEQLELFKPEELKYPEQLRLFPEEELLYESIKPPMEHKSLLKIYEGTSDAQAKSKALMALNSDTVLSDYHQLKRLKRRGAYYRYQIVEKGRYPREEMEQLELPKAGEIRITVEPEQLELKGMPVEKATLEEVVEAVRPTKEPVVSIEKLKKNPTLATYVTKRPKTHTREVVEYAKELLKGERGFIDFGKIPKKPRLPKKDQEILYKIGKRLGEGDRAALDDLRAAYKVYGHNATNHYVRNAITAAKEAFRPLRAEFEKILGWVEMEKPPIVDEVAPIYHGTSIKNIAKIEKEGFEGNETFISTNPNVAKRFGDVLELKLSPNAKIISSDIFYGDVKNLTNDILNKYPDRTYNNAANEAKRAIIQEYKNKGFDGINLGGIEQEYIIWNPNVLKTKSLEVAKSQVEPLLEEARKFKTVEEFEKAFYQHATDKPELVREEGITRGELAKDVIKNGELNPKYFFGKKVGVDRENVKSVFLVKESNIPPEYIVGNKAIIGTIPVKPSFEISPNTNLRDIWNKAHQTPIVDPEKGLWFAKGRMAEDLKGMAGRRMEEGKRQDFDYLIKKGYDREELLKMTPAEMGNAVEIEKIKDYRAGEGGFIDVGIIKKKVVDKLDEWAGIKKDETITAVDDTMKEIERSIESLPLDQRVVKLEEMVKQMRGIRAVKNQLVDLIRVPHWDKAIKPLNKLLTGIRDHANEIVSWGERSLKPLAKIKKVSQETTDAIIESTMKDSLVDLKHLSTEEQTVVKNIFAVTEVMKKKFIKEAEKLDKNTSGALLRAVKADGYKNVREFVEDKMRDVYFPLIRGDGDYILYAKEAGETIWSENFLHPDLALARAKEIAPQFPEAEINIFDVQKDFGFKTARLLDLVHDVPKMKKMLENRGIPVEQVKDLTDILGGEYLKLWAGGRLAKRKGVKGFSTDIKEVMNTYVKTFPRSFVKRFAQPEINATLREIPEVMRPYAENLVEYYMGRVDYEGRVNQATRSVLFHWHLALKGAFGLLNPIQRAQTAYWWALSETKNMPEGRLLGDKLFRKAQADEFKLYEEYIQRFVGGKDWDARSYIGISKILDKNSKFVLIKMLDRGQLESLRTLEIVGGNKTAKALGILAIMSEKSNRVQAALTASYIGQVKSLKGEDLYSYVREFIDSTHWQYRPENRPEIGRGGIDIGAIKVPTRFGKVPILPYLKGAPLFLFKSFPINHLYFLKTLYGKDKAAFTGAVATYLTLAGAAGIVGVDIIEGIVDAFMTKVVGKDDWELAKYEWLEKHRENSKAFRVLEKGITSLVGIEGQVLFGSPDIFTPAILPMLTGIYRDMKTVVDEEGNIDWGEWVKRRAPSAPKHWMGWKPVDIFGRAQFIVEDILLLPPQIRERALEIYEEMDKRVKDRSQSEKVFDAIGFSTKTPAEWYKALNAIKETKWRIRKKTARYHRRIGDAIVEGNDRKVGKVIDEMVNQGLIPDIEAIKYQYSRYREAQEYKKGEKEPEVKFLGPVERGK